MLPVEMLIILSIHQAVENNLMTEKFQLVNITVKLYKLFSVTPTVVWLLDIDIELFFMVVFKQQFNCA